MTEYAVLAIYADGTPLGQSRVQCWVKNAAEATEQARELNADAPSWLVYEPVKTTRTGMFESLTGASLYPT